MIREYKKLLIVDDSEIDRMVLKNILMDEYDISEATNGYEALQIIFENVERFDVILLDVSMPVIDGFGVLQLMKESGIDNIPVFLITAEATKDNVEKAAKYNISEFIGKPFDRNLILSRLKDKLGVIDDKDLSEDKIKETKKYITELKSLYNRYLDNFGKDSSHYERISDLMKILLGKYADLKGDVVLDRNEMDIISSAAYFYDIGKMLVPDERLLKADGRAMIYGDISQNHTSYGAEIIRLNNSKSCEFFVYVCTDICMHHHERYDGKGYPHKLQGDSISDYCYMCTLLDRFDDLFYNYSNHNERQFEYAINTISNDEGIVSPEILSVLKSCQTEIIDYYGVRS